MDRSEIFDKIAEVASLPTFWASRCRLELSEETTFGDLDANSRSERLRLVVAIHGHIE
ncbi:MAG: hypothetical protein ACLU7D_07295 [Collinsella sp.]